MNVLDKNKPLIFLGDSHGDWRELFFRIQMSKLKDCYIISVGDCGIGFERKERQIKQIKMLNEEFKSNNICFKAIRGNHDDPSYFKGENRVCLENFELIEDYSVFSYQDKTIQLIGGAVSIDRTGRQEGVSYWSEEGVVYDKKACKKVDILVTHTAPSQCFPQTFNEMVYGWAKEDAELLQDLTKERSVMDDIFNTCSPSLHLYGHFHSSWTEKINGCKHKLLDIDELWEHK
jgi:predicted phosphodiesterase